MFSKKYIIALFLGLSLFSAAVIAAPEPEPESEPAVISEAEAR